MSVTADILTPNWGADAVDSGPRKASPPSADNVSSLKSVSLGTGDDIFESSARLAPGRDWSKLIDLVQNAARHLRALEAKAQEQELRVHELFQRVREDIRQAGEQVRVAEVRAREVQIQADASVLAAEERAAAAEARARAAEEWLMCVQDAIVAGFSDPTGKIDG